MISCNWQFSLFQGLMPGNIINVIKHELLNYSQNINWNNDKKVSYYTQVGKNLISMGTVQLYIRIDIKCRYNS